MLFPKPMGNTAIESFLSNTCCIISFCSDFMLTFIFESTNVISRYQLNEDSNTLHDGSYLMQRAKLFAYVNNNIDIKRILRRLLRQNN
jgi:hypothetical protein